MGRVVLVGAGKDLIQPPEGKMLKDGLMKKPFLSLWKIVKKKTQ